MIIAVVGCMHGELENLYETLLYLERLHNIKFDLVVCCGDFEAVRNQNDLGSLNMRPTYRSMKSFWKYYSGIKIAPVPTIFIGGNHEASNYLWELYYGGWAAPNMYFLGFAGVVKFGNIRIGGLSGVYNKHHYHLGHYERLPYNEMDIASVYHVCEYDVHKLMQVEEPIDIFLSHDWPRTIVDCGDRRELARCKPYLVKEIREKTLGSKPAEELLGKLKPSYWFSAHLHCKFAAIVQHNDSKETKFLALDKVYPGCDFLQVIKMDTMPGPYEIQYDEEWLAITRKFNSFFPLSIHRANFGGAQIDLQDCRNWVKSRLLERGSKPFEFARTAPCYDPSSPPYNSCFSGHHRNPQTELFLRFLELPYLLDNTSESNDPTQTLMPLIYGGFLNDRGEDTPVDDVVDEMEEFSDLTGVTKTGNW